MPTINFRTTFPSNGDSYAFGAGTSYPPAASGASVNDPIVLVRRSRVGTTYYVSVGLIRFDTSAIPDDATIESATLRLNVYGIPKYANDLALTAEWYDAGAVTDTSDYTATVGSNAYSGMMLRTIPGGGRPIVLDLENVSSISKTGITGIRLHVNGSSAPTGENEITFYSDNYTAPLPSSYFQGTSRFARRGQVRAGAILSVTYGNVGQTVGTTPSGGSSPGSEDDELPGGGISAIPVKPRANVPWRIVLCDRDGVPLQTITKLARDKAASFRMNRPSAFSFTVPSDNPKIAGFHSDGRPFLSDFRVVKAYRLERLVDGTLQYVIRFAGEVWIIEDEGDATTARTRVTCLDPMHRLTRRYTGALRAFTNEYGSIIARKLVDEANAVSDTGLTTEGGVFETTPTRTASYTRKSIGEAIVELASSFNGFDLEVKPLDQQDGILGRLSAYARLGQYQPDIPFGFEIAPHNVSSLSRTLNGETAANRIIGIGSAEAKFAESVGSQAAIGLLEAVESFSDVTNPGFLQALVDEELGFRLTARELVEFTPHAGKGWEPFTHVHIGDTIPLYCGPRVRGGFQGIVRCYGFDLSLDDNGIERVSRFVVSPE